MQTDTLAWPVYAKVGNVFLRPMEGQHGANVNWFHWPACPKGTLLPRGGGSEVVLLRGVILNFNGKLGCG